MTDLLKEAIADAKAVREVAMANAKLALEEAFTPRLQSMIASKLAEESDEMEDDEFGGSMEEGEDEEDYSFDEPVDEAEGEEVEVPAEEPTEEVPAEEPAEEVPVEEPAEEPTEEAPVEEGEWGDDEMDDELQEILRQLEEELDSSDIGNGDNKKPSSAASDDSTKDPGKGNLFEEDDDMAEPDEISFDGGEEETDIQEIIRALREEDEEEPTEEPAEAPAEEPASTEDLEEAYAVIKFLKDKLNEVNLLNSKLLFSNKLFRKYSLNENQKITVIENFDRAGTVREVKLVYATLAESFRSQSNKPTIKKRSLKEGFGGASKTVKSTRPSKKILNEGNESVNRFKKLAGIID